MHNIKTAAFILLFCIWAGAVPPSEEQFVDFLAGVMMIRSNPQLKNEEIASRYQELESVCGVEGRDVMEFLKGYRNKPERWKEVNSKIMDVIIKNKSATNNQEK